MIVNCPSCGTRYSHQLAPGELSRQARCSQCEHQFALRSARRTYVLLPGRASAGASPVPAPGAMRVGMDDPALAAQLSATALQADAGQPAALGYASVAAEASPDVADFSLPETGPPADEAPALELAIPPAEDVVDAPEPVGAKSSEGAGRLVHPIREFIVSMLLGGAAGAGGWFGSIEIGEDPYRWGPGGVAVGLVLALAWVRWLAPRR